MREFGKYRLVEPLATGGMAEVWHAETTGAEGVVKDVAVKLIRGEYEADSAFVRMFIQEARLAARLGHANVVQVFEFDQIEGHYYIAMELVRGRHLGCVVERARQRGVRIGIPRAVQIGADVARALAYAHRLADGERSLGLVHRDVSPHNVLVSFEGEVKLADFGIARVMNLAEATAPGTVKGKTAYMAPEQARGAPVDSRADIFALGVVLWELCAGRRLFARESDAAALAAVLGPEPVSPPSAWNEDVPPDLDALILAALEKDPERRTRSSQELATALATVLLRVTRSPEDVDLRGLMHRLFEQEAAPAAPRIEPTRVRSAAVVAEPVALPQAEPTRRAPAPEESATITVPTRKRRSWFRTGLAAGGVALMAAIVVALLSLRAGRPEPRPDGPAAAPPSTRAHGDPAALGETSAPPPPVSSSSPEVPQRVPQQSAATVLQRTGASVASSAPDGPQRPAPPAAVAPSFNGLAVPEPSSGDGILSVNSVPWGFVSVDGRYLCDSPCSVRLRAGGHHLVVTNSTHRLSATHDVSVRAGHRSELLTTLRRR